MYMRLRVYYAIYMNIYEYNTYKTDTDTHTHVRIYNIMHLISSVCADEQVWVHQIACSYSVPEHENTLSKKMWDNHAHIDPCMYVFGT